jgi:hypothetical protein
MAHPRRLAQVSLDAPLADLRACPRCGSLIDGSMAACPSCGRWLGPGTPALWSGLVVSGSALIVLSFFLPWLNGVDPALAYSLSGYDLARIAQHLATSDGGSRPTAAASIALYLAPLVGLVMLVLVSLVQPLRLRWAALSRLLVGLAAIPCLLSLFAALVAMGWLGERQFTSWPQVGLLGTNAGSLLAIIGGIALGAPGHVWRLGWRLGQAVSRLAR